jgi:arylsulfatase A-like enzyme
MRGRKGSEYEGGHRVPCFIYWPGGDLVGPRDIDVLTAHIDILPTLVDLGALKRPPGPKLHGTSLTPLLRGRPVDWADRALVIDSQRMENLIKWRRCAVMQGHWRLGQWQGALQSHHGSQPGKGYCGGASRNGRAVAPQA